MKRKKQYIVLGITHNKQLLYFHWGTLENQRMRNTGRKKTIKTVRQYRSWWTMMYNNKDDDNNNNKNNNNNSNNNDNNNNNKQLQIMIIIEMLTSDINERKLISFFVHGSSFR